MGRRPKAGRSGKAQRGARVPRRAAGKRGRQAAQVARLAHALDAVHEQQQATAEVLRLISSSSGDIEPVFASILANAVRLCDADTGAINRFESDGLHLVATYNMPPAFTELRRKAPYRPNQTSASGRLLATKAPVHILDLAADRAYLDRNPPTVAAVEIAGIRTTLAVPMTKDNEMIGSITVGRKEVRPFTEKQIEVVRNFAAQAVIAIENTRLLHALQQRTAELGRTIAELRRERNNKLMNLEAMAASIGHEVRQPLAGISGNGGAALRFLGHTPPNIEEVRLALDRMVADSHRASQVFDNIRALFGRADQGHEPIDINELARDVLQALHEELLTVTTQAALSAPLPPVMGHRGQLQEVLINLVRNAIEAMDAVKDGPRVLQLSAEPHGDDAVAVSVEDSGAGIDPKQMEAIFDAFITTKQHGMGLGLALCRMIIERHEGRLSAAPAHPRGAVFRMVLPAGRRS